MTVRAPGRAVAARRRGWVPNQHGAWAMLAVPFLAGTLRSGPVWAHLLLLACWLLGYFAFFAAGQWLRSGRSTRRSAPVQVYGLAALAAVVPLLVVRPDVLVWSVVYLPLAGLSLGYSARRADRALVNDALTILAACLIMPVAFHLGVTTPPWTPSTEWSGTWWATAALVCYFFGTSLYVKTVIRERRNPTYHRASTAYHAAVTAVWLGTLWWDVPVRTPISWALVAFFAVMTVRAAVMAGRRVAPMKVGLGEVVASAVLLAIVLAW